MADLDQLPDDTQEHNDPHNSNRGADGGVNPPPPTPHKTKHTPSEAHAAQVAGGANCSLLGQLALQWSIVVSFGLFPIFTSISYYMLTVMKYYIIQYLSAPGTCYLTNQLKQSFTEKSKVTIPIKKRISKLSNFCFRSFKQNFKQNFKRISSGFRDPADRWQPNSILSVMTLS